MNGILDPTVDESRGQLSPVAPPSADDLRYQRAGHVREPHVAATESVRQLRVESRTEVHPTG